ncbi:Dyslexia-associated protein KIAA0319 [Merluccius polli]|uniref:Dyslexia-associated protein KIAA0319 n=1 Tax=Merluccius polli TaxID=89951 RepID=A0AA47N3K5_MERPO|nr:Dyslexia-associated protein KIAA0319 [Merluccius polli]
MTWPGGGPLPRTCSQRTFITTRGLRARARRRRSARALCVRSSSTSGGGGGGSRRLNTAKRSLGVRGAAVWVRGGTARRPRRRRVGPRRHREASAVPPCGSAAAPRGVRGAAVWVRGGTARRPRCRRVGPRRHREASAVPPRGSAAAPRGVRGAAVWVRGGTARRPRCRRVGPRRRELSSSWALKLRSAVKGDRLFLSSFHQLNTIPQHEVVTMTPSALLLWVLLQSVGETSQCRQGATFSEAVLSTALSGSSILWVPGVTSLAHCLVSCCDLPRCDLAWLFQRRCYILNCQQGETCRPQDRPGADSYLAFVRRGPPLMRGSLIRGEPYRGRWKSSSSSEVSEAPGDVEALRDLAVLEGEERPRDRGGGGRDLETGLLSHWPVEESEGKGEWPVMESSLAVNGSSGGPSSSGALRGQLREPSPTFHPAENREASPSTTSVRPSPWKPTTRSTQQSHIRTSLPTEATPQLSVTTFIGIVLLISVSAVKQSPHAVVDPPSQVLSSPVREVVLNASQSEGDGLLSCEWEQISGPPVHLGRSADTWSLYLAHLETGNYTFRVTVTDSAGSSDSTAATVLVVPTDTSQPTAETPFSAQPSTSDPTNPLPPRHDDDLTVTSPTPIAPQMIATTSKSPVSLEEGAMNRGPVAVVGPDRKLVLPVSSFTLDGSDSHDDQAVVHYHWNATRAVATATGLRVGRYTFRLTVSDQQGATDSAVLTVRVEEDRVLPPIAHASGSHTLTLPNNSLVLRGSVTDGDQTQVHFLWVRDSQIPPPNCHFVNNPHRHSDVETPVGSVTTVMTEPSGVSIQDVLYGSQTQASLHLSNLVEGTYLFQLRVTDAQGRGSVATATVEVRPDPVAREEVDVEVLVGVSQVSVAQRDTVIRQLAALLHVLDNNIQLHILPGHSHLSAVLRLSVRGPEGPLPGSKLVQVLRNQLLREKTDYLLFRVLRVDTVFCLLRCSGRGQCDPITKECVCDPFWTENLIRRYFGDRERNCEWRVLYVVMSSFLALILVLMISWSLLCCCRRRKRSTVRKKTKYTILDDMDDQERVELRPKHGIKHRSTEHASSLMMSESELDSEQDTQPRPARPQPGTSPGTGCRKQRKCLRLASQPRGQLLDHQDQDPLPTCSGLTRPQYTDLVRPGQ